MAAASPDEPQIPATTEAGATMIYTSGTTGKPKGALRRGVADPVQLGAMLQLIGYTPDDVYITTGPLYHSGPGGFMGVAQALGQTIVLQRKFDPEDWLRLVDKYKVTSTFAAPTPIRMICSLPDEVKASYDRLVDADHDRQRRAVELRAQAAVRRRLPARRRCSRCTAPPSSASTRAAAGGSAAQARLVRQARADGRDQAVRRRRQRGHRHRSRRPRRAVRQEPSVFADYYKQHDKYEEDQSDGYQTVGDIAYRDDEGFFYICDRKKDMIISGGMNIYPAEIEAALEPHPDIYEAAVFGIPSDEWGETVHAVVVQRRAPSSTTRLCPRPRSPRQLQGAALDLVVDELPKTGAARCSSASCAAFWAGRTSEGLMPMHDVGHG